MQGSKQAHDFLTTNQRDFQAVFGKLKWLAELNQQVLAVIADPALIKYCQVANFQQNRLVLLVANGSIATQLHYQLPELTRKLQAIPQLAQLESIQCKVRPSYIPPLARSFASKNRAMALLSPPTARIVAEVSQTIADPQLREVMLRIAQKVTAK